MATTTEKAIRDQAIAVIGAIAPTLVTNTRFIVATNDELGAFVQWAESSPDAAFRRFYVRTTGNKDKPVEVSNTDFTMEYVELSIIVAYPKTSPTGPRGALDRDDTMRADRQKIENAVGLLGAANFTPPNPDATYRGHTPSVERSMPVCDYLIIDQMMSYYLAT